MCHQHDKCYLTHIGAFARHVGAGQNQKPVLLCVKQRIVWNKPFLDGALHHRMAAIHDIDCPFFLHMWAAIIVFKRNLSKRTVNIQLRDQLCVLLQPFNAAGKRFTQFQKELILQGNQFFLRTDDRLLKLLEFRRDVTLRVGQSLLSLICIWHKALIGFRNVDIIPKHPVITDLQVLNARCRTLIRFHLRNPALTIACRLAQGIHFRIESITDHAAFLYADRRVFDDCVFQKCADILHCIKVCCDTPEFGGFQSIYGIKHFRQAAKRSPERITIPGVHCAVGDAAAEAFNVINRVQRIAQRLARMLLFEEFLHRIKPCVDIIQILKRLFQPGAQKARAHRCGCLIKKIQERALLASFKTQRLC